MKQYIQQLGNDLIQLCQAHPQVLAKWITQDKQKISVCLLFLSIGSGAYGASLGLGRAPLQSVYVAIKFPLLLFFTGVGTALINGMLAQLLGAQLSFRQSFLSVLISFALLAVILGSLAPLSLFLLYNLPSFTVKGVGYDIFLLSHVLLITLAGVLANMQLYALLRYLCANKIKAQQILFSWLTMNLFLGAQISWNLRPFFGNPGLSVAFLREDAFRGSFYEAVFYKSLALFDKLF